MLRVRPVSWGASCRCTNTWFELPQKLESIEIGTSSCTKRDADIDWGDALNQRLFRA